MNWNAVSSSLIRPPYAGLLLRRLFVVIGALVLGTVVLSGPAVAHIPSPGGSWSGVCTGEEMSHMAKRYYRVLWGTRRLPLSCSSWSYGAQRAWGNGTSATQEGWDVWWDGLIGLNLWNASAR